MSKRVIILVLITSAIYGALVGISLYSENHSHTPTAPAENGTTNFAITEDDAPACYVEPNPDVSEGVEIIYYPHIWMHDKVGVGLELPLSDCGH